MKLNRDDFNVLVPPPPSGGGSGSGPSIRGVEPITGGEGSGDTGDSGDPKGDDPTGGETVSETVISVTPGSMISPEESEALQRQIGVPIELPGEGEDEKMSKEAARHVDKLTSNRGGIGGRGDGLLRRAIAKLNNPQIDWKSALKRFIGKALSSTEQYLGSRRHLYKGDYFYGEKNKYESLENAVVAVDTSGSMSVEAIELILSEVKGIITAKKIKNTTIVYFDDGIQDTDTIKGTKKVFDMRKAKGGGGTSFVEPLRYMEEQYKKGKMQLGVFMTDGYANLNLSIPKFKKEFVWVILDNPLFVPPFGNLVVHISQKQMK
jgi:predicted metal-dependent peptidase